MLRAECLCYKSQSREIIKDISLEFKPHLLYGILGPNGAGKSTFLKLLNGIWSPSSGRVLWKEEDLLKKTRIEISRTIAFVPQNLQIPFDYIVEDIVAMGLYPHGNLSNADIIEKSLYTVDAWHLRKKSLNQLSNGERQRIYIARALATDAPVVLLDEPTASLDIKHQLEMWNLFYRLKQSGKSIIVTMHDLHSAERFCDSLLVFNQGQCIARGKFEELIREPVFQDVFGVVENKMHSARRFELV